MQGQRRCHPSLQAQKLLQMLVHIHSDAAAGCGNGCRARYRSSDTRVTRRGCVTRVFAALMTPILQQLAQPRAIALNCLLLLLQ